MIRSSVVRAHQHTAVIKSGEASPKPTVEVKEGYSTKIQVLTDALGNLLEIVLTPVQAGIFPQVRLLLEELLSALEVLEIGAVLVDEGWDWTLFWNTSTPRKQKSLFHRRKIDWTNAGTAASYTRPPTRSKGSSVGSNITDE
jgi:transposase